MNHKLVIQAVQKLQMFQATKLLNLTLQLSVKSVVLVYER